MDKRTVSSAHTRIDGLEKDFVAVKTQIDIQMKDLFNRVKRLEAIMIGTSGFIIVLLLRMSMVGQGLSVAILETIAAANAAYGIIQKCLKNGQEVTGLVSQVGKFLTAEDELKEAIKRKKNSPITSITGGQEGDWEEFQALEDLQRKRKELESWCRLYGPPGTWDRWQQYQAEARKARRAAEKQRQKEREEMIETMTVIVCGFIAIGATGAAFYWLGKFMEKW